MRQLVMEPVLDGTKVESLPLTLSAARSLADQVAQLAVVWDEDPDGFVAACDRARERCRLYGAHYLVRLIHWYCDSEAVCYYDPLSLNRMVREKAERWLSRTVRRIGV